MGIRFGCHHCGRKLNVKNDLANKRGVCPQCEGRFRIPPQDAIRSLPLDEPGDVRGPTRSDTPRPDTPRPDTPRPVVAATGRGPAAGGLTAEVLNEEPSATWYVRPDAGGQYGPADAGLLGQWIGEGRVPATALVWRDGWTQWRTAGDVFDGLPTPAIPAAAAGGRQSTSPQSTPTSPPALTGDASIGKTKQRRSGRRFVWIGGLVSLCVVLAAALYWVIARGPG